MNRVALVCVTVAMLTLAVGAALAAPGAPAKAQDKGQAAAPQLTAEQRTQLLAKMRELKAAGKPPDEIRQAATEMLKGWGLEMPPGGLLAVVTANLTPEQKQEMRAKVKEMRAAGAKPEEIRAAVAQMFKDWGIVVPDRAPGKGGLASLNLTDDQRQQVEDKIKALRKGNTKPEEIEKAVREMLKGWGVTGTFNLAGKGDRLGRDFLRNLTEEQRKELRTKMKQLRAEGKTPAEIKAAVADLLKGWGVKPPEGHEAGKGQRGQFSTEDLKDLTPEQRQQVLSKIDEMQKAGSTPEEIRRTIMEMIKEYGTKA
jgi:Spy/CpxP family protein refolding chaperone